MGIPIIASLLMKSPLCAMLQRVCGSAFATRGPINGENGAPAAAQPAPSAPGLHRARSADASSGQLPKSLKCNLTAC